MYFIEGKTGGFASIPNSIYWAITTLTAIGYGDIVPQTGIGRAVHSIITLLGSSIIIIPIVIVIAEIYNSLYKAISGRSAEKILSYFPSIPPNTIKKYMPINVVAF